MPRDARFWRNVAIIAVAHIAVLSALLHWNRVVGRQNLQSIVWMNGGVTEIAAQSMPAQTEMAIEKAAQPETLESESKERAEPPISTQTESELQLPTTTPLPAPAATPAPEPSRTPVRSVSSAAVGKSTSKPPRKKPVLAGVTPKPSSKKKPAPLGQEKKSDESKKETAKIAPDNASIVNADKSGSTGSSETARASEFSWYGKMLHDRFYSEWIQPKTSVAVGAKISVLVKIRIEKDGRISTFTIAKPSGNVVVDESVSEVAKRVTQVDPLPKGLGGGAYYEVNINFELNPER